MPIDFQFAAIDVDIIAHPKAFAAGVDAMGLWAWGLAYAKRYSPSGRLPRASVLAAWGGRRNIMLAKRLVDAGLWTDRDDGDWDIWNYEKKGPGMGRRSSAAERQSRYRARRRGDVTGVTGDVTPSNASDITGVTSSSVSVSVSEVKDNVTESQRDRVEPPEWFVGALGTVGMATGEAIDPGATWLRYRGHRATKGAPMGVRDAEYWVTSVVVPELRRERQLRRERDETRRHRDAPEASHPQPTAEQSRAMADEIMRRVRGDKGAA